MAAGKLASGNPVGCPRCGEPLAVASSSSSIDKPLQECASCGGILVRSGVKEWSLLRTSEKLASVARHALVVFAVGAALPLAHRIVVFCNDQPWRLQDSLRWLAVGAAFGATMQGARLTRRIRESRRRMRDPMYLAKLVQKEIVEASRR
jgi:hypothetical protein